jgi:caspase domain-containing protein
LRWAIVIGIDEYRGGVAPLSAAVHDAEAFYDWVVDKKGGQVPARNVRVLLGRRPEERRRRRGERIPTKDAVIGAINEVMSASEGVGERFFFFFSGHGVISTYATREESALVTSGYDNEHPDETIAVRSITEFFETTQFADQFFFIDACRTKPQKTAFEIGSWPIPRRRDPGQPPAQQFILYATSPGREAMQLGWAEESLSAFSDVLMRGLRGAGAAKAWSWERSCYEVRWEALATYVKTQMERRRNQPDEGSRTIQVPQDGGSRGVEGRDRDVCLAILPRADVSQVPLTLKLDEGSDDEADLEVFDAIGRSVATAKKITGSYTVPLFPRTYAARARTAAGRIGRLPVPVQLYDEDDQPKPIEWLEPGAKEEPDQPDTDGTIKLRSRDPLAVAEIRDETGRVIGLTTPKRGCVTPPGFYRVRLIAPERENAADERTIALGGGKQERVPLQAPPPSPYAAVLADALGGSAKADYVIPLPGAEPVAWAQPSTVIAAALGSTLQGSEALRSLGLDTPLASLRNGKPGVAVYAVAGDGDPSTLEKLSVRMWSAGDPVPDEATPLKPTESGFAVAAVVTPADDAESDDAAMYWVSIERRASNEDRTEPTVVALPVLKGRLATLIAQADLGRLRLYQFQPTAGAAPSTTPARFRRLEHLQRLLLGGRIDAAEALAREVAPKALAKEVAAEPQPDPFAWCLAGYVLLRLGRYEGLGRLASAIVAAEPRLSDAYILRGEYEAYVQNTEAANQAFAQAVAAGIPAFGEGLTRLVEGLRASGFLHPRGAIVRYIFQRHARGIMWAAFTPSGKAFRPGRPVITAADLGFEA